MNIKMNKIIFYISVLGWTLGLIVHLLSIAGIDIANKVPYVWVLHVGIFIVWIPTILGMRKNEELQLYMKSGLQNRMNPTLWKKAFFKSTPAWVVIIALGGFVYAFINFGLFVLSNQGVPSNIGGSYFLENHGRIIKILTEQEYHYYKANELRGFSGHWLAFYGLAAAISFPVNRSPKEE